MSSEVIIAPCAQCGLPAAVRKAGQKEGPFCCTGCALAYHVGGSFGSGGNDRLLARVLLSAFLTMGVMAASLALYGDLLGGGDIAERNTEAARALSDLGRAAALLLTAPIVYLLGVPLLEAVIAGRRWLSTESLVIAGTAAAIGVSTWHTIVGEGVVWFESAALVLVLVGLGRWMDARARERSRKGLELLAPKSVQPALRLSASGEEAVDVQSLVVGDHIRLRPGDLLPVDGVVIAGRAFLDQAALTGEAEPRAVRSGDRVLSGSTIVDGTLVVEAEAVGEGRIRAEIERVLARALGAKGQHVELADRVSAVLFPIVLALAAVAGWYQAGEHGVATGVRTALAVVLISCPCALGIATPLAFWTALGIAWHKGILVRGADVLERLARIRRVFFDKTGTLTDGELTLSRVLPHDQQSPSRHLRLAASIELGSEHPIARAFHRAHSECPDSGPLLMLEELRVHPGLGVAGRIAGAEYLLRRAEAADSLLERASATTVVVLEYEGRVLCEFHLTSRLRPEALGLVQALRAQGFQLALLTGDRKEAAQQVAQDLGLEAHAQLLPHEKVRQIESAGKLGTLYVGDGLNDAAAMAAADVGLAVAGSSPRTVEVADVTLLSANIAEVAPLCLLARSAVRSARFNLLWAFAYNFVGLWFAATGRLTPVWAAIAMVLSSATVVLASARAGRSQRELLTPSPAFGHSPAAAELRPSSAGS